MIPIAAAAGAVTITALVALSAFALGGTFNSINHVAPYRGGSFAAYNQVNSFCSKNRFGVAPHWSNATGVGGWTSISSSKTCLPTLGGTSLGSAGTTLSIAIPLHIPSGAHSVQVGARVAFTASQSIHIGGACPAVLLDPNGNGHEYCVAFTQFCFSGCYAQTNYLWDATNNTYVYSSTNMRSYDNYTYIYNNTVCSSFTCTNYNGSNSLNAPSSVNTNFTWYFNSTMVKSHHYWAVIMFTGWASSTIQGFPKSTASASLNIATFGNGLNITSVNVV